MHFLRLRLSGFKSFVDPTVIGTPGQLVGIVGPNGCGKSNVIDAVRWVLGESKASALRGESMQDVIFNGAGERKPVGRASVELLRKLFEMEVPEIAEGVVVIEAAAREPGGRLLAALDGVDGLVAHALDALGH